MKLFLAVKPRSIVWPGGRLGRLLAACDYPAESCAHSRDKSGGTHASHFAEQFLEALLPEGIPS